MKTKSVSKGQRSQGQIQRSKHFALMSDLLLNLFFYILIVGAGQNVIAFTSFFFWPKFLNAISFALKFSLKFLNLLIIFFNVFPEGFNKIYF